MKSTTAYNTIHFFSESALRRNKISDLKSEQTRRDINDNHIPSLSQELAKTSDTDRTDSYTAIYMVQEEPVLPDCLTKRAVNNTDMVSETCNSEEPDTARVSRNKKTKTIGTRIRGLFACFLCSRNEKMDED